MVICQCSNGDECHAKAKSEKCQPPFYRLGDLVKGRGANLKETRQYHLEQFPNSLGAAFVRAENPFIDEIKNTCSTKGRETESATAMHLRVGDQLHKLNKSKIVKQLKDSSFLVWGIHNSKLEDESKEFVSQIVKDAEVSGKHVTQLRSDDPDEDFCRLFNAKEFVQSNGGFSELVQHFRKMK
jgi:hypothetical protein